MRTSPLPSAQRGEGMARPRGRVRVRPRRARSPWLQVLQAEAFIAFEGGFDLREQVDLGDIQEGGLRSAIGRDFAMVLD